MWKIAYYDASVEEAVLALPETLLARYARLTEMVKTHGPNLGMPYTRALGDGLFELRLKGKEGIARAFFCTLVKKEILILHLIIKKQTKTPLQDLRLARKRLKEVHHEQNA